ncbi:MAG: 4'-phosphopantetheinyl transferase superfamily protein [Chlorobi bacterium]|nr:4'-phosphopantetheinyl transferase superfamily protein [Chlorobiota bacterium]
MPDLNIIFEKTNNDYSLKLAKFEKNSDFLFQQIKNFLKDNEIANFLKIKNEKRKIEWLGTRILLKKMLGFYTEIQYNNNGSPYLKIDRHISITHSKNYIGIILSKNKNTGIDIEIISDRILKTASKFIPDTEIKTIKTHKEIYLHWCSKETLFKIKGGGGYDFKKDFVLAPFQAEEKGTITAFITKYGKEQFILSYLFMSPGNRELLLVWHG